MPAQSHTDDLRLAHVLADNADSLAMKRFRAPDLRVTAKSDGTSVTDADTAVEESIRNTLATARPRDAVHGEEGEDTGWGPRQWVIDPIDGTHGYMRGVPVWATLIALVQQGEVVVGMVSAPALNRRWWASVGNGAWAGKSLLSGNRIHVSDVDALEDSSVSYTSLEGWASRGRGRGFGELLRTCRRSRGFGDFWSHMLVAEGAIDVAAESDVALHDVAALSVIVSEAGGRFTNIDGGPGLEGPGVLTTNGHLHDAVVAQLAPHDDDRPLVR